jgi:thiamine-phosphate pyrophosphorylase
MMLAVFLLESTTMTLNKNYHTIDLSKMNAIERTKPLNTLKLCLITRMDRSPEHDRSFLLDALSGGVTCVQLRDKSCDLQRMRRRAMQLKSFLPNNVPLIINDDVSLAKEIAADGVHLGQSDLSPIEARQLLGPNAIIGLSIETLEQLETANQLNCIDYVSASSVFSSKNKSDCPVWGLSGLKAMVHHSIHPVIAIGGIYLNNVQAVCQQGVLGIAVIDALYGSSNPKWTAQQLRNAIG